jgi:hypothetical protein
MRVIRVAPSAFGRDWLFGCGERYPYELARLAKHVSFELVTFGPDSSTTGDGRLTIRALRPLAYLGGQVAEPVEEELHLPTPAESSGERACARRARAAHFGDVIAFCGSTRPLNCA